MSPYRAVLQLVYQLQRFNEIQYPKRLKRCQLLACSILQIKALPSMICNNGAHQSHINRSPPSFKIYTRQYPTQSFSTGFLSPPKATGSQWICVLTEIFWIYQFRMNLKWSILRWFLQSITLSLVSREVGNPTWTYIPTP